MKVKSIILDVPQMIAAEGKTIKQFWAEIFASEMK